MSRSEPNFVMLSDEERPASVDQLRRQALRLLQRGVDYTTRGDEAGEARDYAQTRGIPPNATSNAPAPARAVMIGVVTMPAVFLVVVMGALALFGKPAPKSRTEAAAASVDTLEQPPATTATSASFAAAHSTSAGPVISLSEDTRIVDISLDGDRVAMHIESPAGQQIVIYDYEKGRIIARAPIETASIEAIDSLSMLTGAPPPSAKLALAAPALGQASLAPAPGVAEMQRSAPQAPAMKPRSAD